MQSFRRVFEAHNPLNNQNKLQVLISEEKDVVQKLIALDKDTREVGKYAEQWGADTDPLVHSITIAMNRFYQQLGELFNELSGRYEESRRFLKALRSREQSLHTLKQRQKKLSDDLETARKKNKTVTEIERELAHVTSEIEKEDAEITVFRRQVLQDNFEAKLTGLYELSAKLNALYAAGSDVASGIPDKNANPNELASGPWEADALKKLDIAAEKMKAITAPKIEKKSDLPIGSFESLNVADNRERVDYPTPSPQTLPVMPPTQHAEMETAGVTSGPNAQVSLGYDQGQYPDNGQQLNRDPFMGNQGYDPTLQNEQDQAGVPQNLSQPQYSGYPNFPNYSSAPQ